MYIHRKLLKLGFQPYCKDFSLTHFVSMYVLLFKVLSQNLSLVISLHTHNNSNDVILLSSQ